MSNVLPLRDIIFGKTDAFNELKEFGIDWFIKAFFPYEKYEIDSFVRGNSYFICGEKGTGKTAFLRYLQCVLSEDTTSLIIPIRFKSDIDNEERKSMVRASIITPAIKHCHCGHWYHQVLDKVRESGDQSMTGRASGFVTVMS